MNYWREFSTVGGQEKYFLVSIKISLYCNGAFKKFENRPMDNIILAKMNFEFEFCISKGDNP